MEREGGTRKEGAGQEYIYIYIYIYIYTLAVGKGRYTDPKSSGGACGKPSEVPILTITD